VKQVATAADCPETIITVRVVPRASKTSITEVGPSEYKIHLTAPPVDGTANKQLIKILSGKLRLPSRQIRIIAGESARIKRLRIEGCSGQELTRLLTTK